VTEPRSKISSQKNVFKHLIFNNEPWINISHYQRHPLADLHTYLARQRRDSFLVEFERKLSVRVELDKELGFDVFLPSNHEGPVDSTLISQVEIALMNLQTRREKNLPVTRDNISYELNRVIAGRLTPQFAKEAANPNASAYSSDFSAKKPATAALPPDRFACPVQFSLPLFDEYGHLDMTGTDGTPKAWDLTANQRAYKDAHFDPDKRLIVAHGVAGSAKTDIMIWCALRMLQMGLIKKIYFDRPMVAIDDIKLGALPGGLDGKTGPYNSVFVSKIIEWLAEGQRDKGVRTYNELLKRNALEQYNGLLKAGDTITNAILLVDEAQNKSLNELYHLGTRAGDGSKVVISGDFEFQNSLTGKRQSGFKDLVEIATNVPLARIIEMGEQDCKRSELARQLYTARKAFEAARFSRQPNLAPPLRIVPSAPNGPS
jgi:hypothetical protein